MSDRESGITHPKRGRPVAASRVVAMVVANAAFGAAAGMVFALGVLVSDGFGLGTLIWRDAGPAAALALWFGGTMAGFSAFAVATAAIQMSGADAEGGTPLRVPVIRRSPAWAGAVRRRGRRTP